MNPAPYIHERGNLEPQPLYTNPILFLLAISAPQGP
ncbi:hypothetical protein BN1708_015099 [Verticillium longisporum]|uniref:Uncharacterized protein n=1 Tax=Verticillium longisporum TaxID=100787 RepID=A0A0G4M1C5_VERLO|nr:hypothetical protein BN1708_015099 [Verticillium longisporum]